MERPIAQGAVIAGLGPRLLAAVLDRLPLAALGLAWYLIVLRSGLGNGIIWTAILAVLALGWIVVQWWAYGSRKAGLGYRICGLQLVDLHTGQPIGWWRAFLRVLVLNGCWALILPGIGLVIFIVIQERRQGWHDLAARSIAITRQHRDAITTATATTAKKGPTPVALPPHLLGSTYVSPEIASEVQNFGPVQDAGPAGGVRQAPGPITSVPGYSPGTGQPSQPITQVPDFGSRPPVRTATPSAGGGQFGNAASAAGAGTNVPGGYAQPGGAPGAGYQTHPQAGPGYPGQQGYSRPHSYPSPGRDTGADDDYGGTQLRPAGAGSGFGSASGYGMTAPARVTWRVQLDDGRTQPVSGLLLIGRRPTPRPDEAGAHLLPCGEPSQTVSKTHLLIGVDAAGLYLVDRNSTNGTALITGPDRYQPCPPGVPVRLHAGQQVSFGDRRLTVLQ